METGRASAEAATENPNSLSMYFLNNTVDNLSAMLDLLTRQTPVQLNALVYSAAYDAALDRNEDSAAREELFAFCTSDTYGSCSMLTFNAYDYDKQVTEYYHSVESPACRDTFSPSEQAWRALSSTPPTDLVQDYFACKAKPIDALFNSMGIAAGTAKCKVVYLAAVISLYC
jgi:hypothetical protein